MDEASLQRKLAAIEALAAGATTEGERGAAMAARERIRARLAELTGSGRRIGGAASTARGHGAPPPRPATPAPTATPTPTRDPDP